MKRGMPDEVEKRFYCVAVLYCSCPGRVLRVHLHSCWDLKWIGILTLSPWDVNTALTKL